jgi:aspartokinase/homoserine dehydrogenase 1
MGDKDLIVEKFGGTSVRDAEAFRNCANIIRDCARRDRLIVVLSAMAGMTNLIFSAMQAAETADWLEVDARLAVLSERHQTIIQDLLNPHEAGRLCRITQRLVDELGAICCASRPAPRRLSARDRDSVAALGEHISAQVLTSYLSEIGIHAEFVGADKVIVTDDQFGNASPEMQATTEHCTSVLLPIVRRGCIPVITGYCGATKSGQLTTLGRGGSDYSATIIGAATGASEVCIWTDVDGVMTADPQVCPKASLIPEISITQALEMSYYGAKVIHPRAVRSALSAPFNLRIRNSFRPAHSGTRVLQETDTIALSTLAICVVNPATMINLRMDCLDCHCELLAGLSTRFKERRIEPLFMNQSHARRCLTVGLRDQDIEELVGFIENHLARLPARHSVVCYETLSDVAVVALSGIPDSGKANLLAQVFSEIAKQQFKISIAEIGPAESSVRMVVPSTHAVNLVCYLHDEMCCSSQVFVVAN